MKHKAKNYLLFWKGKKNIKKHIEYDMLLNTIFFVFFFFVPHLIYFFPF